MSNLDKHTASAIDEALEEADRENAPNDEKGALERSAGSYRRRLCRLQIFQQFGHLIGGG
jgi:hypothetical protein